MLTIAAGEFKTKCLSILDNVKNNREKVIITKHGKPIAELVPLKINKNKEDKDHELRGSVLFETDIVSPLEDIEWEALK